MKLILTNDDGYDAPGLAALWRACEGLGELVVVAPRDAHSGVGHRVTTHDPISLEQIEPGSWRVGGTPADCARIALRHLVDDATWLIAGINRGGNLGADIYMSGTAAAAREGALLGCRALSISQYVGSDRTVDWDTAIRGAKRVIREIVARPPEEHHFWNINLPVRSAGGTRDTVFCPPDPSPLDVKYRREGGDLLYDGDYHQRPRVPGHDVDVCFSGNIAVSAVPLDIGK